MVKLFSKNSNLCDHNPPTSQTDRRTDGQTDRQTTCDGNTALCTKVHRAVKINAKSCFLSKICRYSTQWVHILEDIWINMESWHLPTTGFDPIIRVNLSSYWLHMIYWRNVIKATVLTSVFWISVRRLTLCHINVWSANYESMASMVKCYPELKPSCCAGNNSYFVMALSRNTPHLRQVFPKEQYWGHFCSYCTLMICHQLLTQGHLFACSLTTHWSTEWYTVRKTKWHLARLEQWAESWGMVFNASKYHIMHVSRSSSSHQYLYQFRGVVLSSVTSEKYLGIYLNHDLKWSHHIDQVTAKAARKLGFVRRNLRGSPADCKKLAYISLVRSGMEYASIIWDPYIYQGWL